jgi:hypothetical protein
MGLRSFVALPVDKGGSVLRLLSDYNYDTNTNVLMTSVAYGISGTQTLLFGLPYRLSPNGDNRLSDISALYRQTLWQNDTAGGTNRFSFLGGFILPTDSNRDGAAQVGFVFTHFKDRHEIDIDALYQKGFDNRIDSGRYDISWQYRVNPAALPDWGIEDEIYSVLEINGRWKQGNSTSQQITAGVTWVKPKWVIEAGLVKELNNQEDTHLILSTRFHF